MGKHKIFNNNIWNFTLFTSGCYRYQVYQVKAKDKVSFDVLVNLYNERSDVYDFWTEPRNVDTATDIMVPPAFTKTFVELLEVFNMEYRIKIDDVQQ